MDDQQNGGMNDEYPVQYNVDYKDGTRNRLTSLFRWILMIPSLVVLALAGGLILATLPMILFRKKYPRWFFDYQLQYAKFSARVTAYASLQMDEYPSTDEEQSAQLDITYPDAEAELNRFLPLVKWILAIPHFIVIYILSIISAILTFIAWLAIIITGRYPKALFDFNVGVSRWTYRVAAYAFLLTTDRYPPFSLN